MLSSSILAELVLSEAHHFEHFALELPKAIEQVGCRKEGDQSYHKNVQANHDFD